MDYSQVLSHFGNLGLALAIGLLVGSERGWHRRNYAEGERVAGIRTFALMALLGGLVTASGQHLAPEWALLASALAFMPLALLLVAGYLLETRHDGDLSITTPVAAMATFWLGAMPALGLALPAAASAVVLTLLLHLKGKLHHWLEVLDQQELLGTLQFLLLSVVLLPL
ncbi:MAG TPA: MgtC/SapB family protein, partial [Kineobactrum sp.]